MRLSLGQVGIGMRCARAHEQRTEGRTLSASTARADCAADHVFAVFAGERARGCDPRGAFHNARRTASRSARRRLPRRDVLASASVSGSRAHRRRGPCRGPGAGRTECDVPPSGARRARGLLACRAPRACSENRITGRATSARFARPWARSARVRERRDHIVRRDRTHLEDRGIDRRPTGNSSVGRHRDHGGEHDARSVEADALRPATSPSAVPDRSARLESVHALTALAASLAYALMMSRTRRWRITSASLR